MNQELYLKIIVMGAVLVVALLSPTISALAVTAMRGMVHTRQEDRRNPRRKISS